MVEDKDIMQVAVSGGLAASGLLLVFLGFVQSFYRQMKDRDFYTGWREDAAYFLVWAIALATVLATMTTFFGLLWLTDWWRISVDLLAGLLVAVISAMMLLGLATVVVLVRR